MIGIEEVDIAIIGAGFGGIAAAHQLRSAGFTDLIVLERAGEVGGVWRANTYPGCACDVPSALYSLSFSPNPHWTRRYAQQPEIQQYLAAFVDSSGLRERIRLNCHVQSCKWQEATRRWELRTSQGTMSVRVLVAALGGLTEPRIPQVPGLAQFPGKVIHTANWNHDHALTGERVAVVGTGASAIQVVPALQPIVGRMVVYQRTAPWVLPRRDRLYSAKRRQAFQRVPMLLQAARLATYGSLEPRAIAFVRDPALMRFAERDALRFLAREVADPDLRAKLTPGYRLGCKRALLSDDWYRALTRSNVEVVAAGIRELRGRIVLADDGTQREVDAIVLATGFHVLDSPAWDLLAGSSGVTLAQRFQGGPRAYKGTTVPEFPNLFLITGPNTGLGHTSMITMIESQVAYVVSALQGMRDHGVNDVEVRPRAMQQWNEGLDRRLAGTVWATGGCSSYYQDAQVG